MSEPAPMGAALVRVAAPIFFTTRLRVVVARC
jgi:hypothetical protein